MITSDETRQFILSLSDRARSRLDASIDRRTPRTHDAKMRIQKVQSFTVRIANRWKRADGHKSLQLIIRDGKEIQQIDLLVSPRGAVRRVKE